MWFLKAIYQNAKKDTDFWGGLKRLMCKAEWENWILMGLNLSKGRS